LVLGNGEWQENINPYSRGSRKGPNDTSIEGNKEALVAILGVNVMPIRIRISKNLPNGERIQLETDIQSNIMLGTIRGGDNKDILTVAKQLRDTILEYEREI
jgi:hypothetical protein